MTAETVFILLGAGFLGGMANAMAGGASLITFPAMMAAGLAPIPANASNAAAVVCGNIVGAWVDRHKLPVLGRSIWLACAAAVIGGAVGAALLLLTPEDAFEGIVPALVGLATLLFAYSKHIQGWVSRNFATQSKLLQTGLVFPAATYGGYFGAGLGVILLSVLSATSNWELRTTNAFKNLLGVLANVAAIIVFFGKGIVVWPETLVMMAACLVGGYIGAKALTVISSATMRRAITVIGLVMTAYYAWAFWF
jgi:uncharacterized protein